MKLTTRRSRRTSRSLNALSFGPATDEFLNDRFPSAALAQKSFDDFAQRAASATRIELPGGDADDFWRSIRRSGGDGHARHRREVGEIVAGVEDLIEGHAEFLREALGLFEFVRSALS